MERAEHDGQRDHGCLARARQVRQGQPDVFVRRRRPDLEEPRVLLCDVGADSGHLAAAPDGRLGARGLPAGARRQVTRTCAARSRWPKATPCGSSTTSRLATAFFATTTGASGSPAIAKRSTAQNQTAENWAAQWSGVLRSNWSMEAAAATYKSLITSARSKRASSAARPSRASRTARSTTAPRSSASSSGRASSSTSPATGS